MSLAVDALTGAAGTRVVERQLRRRIFRPPPRWTISQRADRRRFLGQESSAEPGRWRTSRAPFQREIMDTVGDPHVHEMLWIAPSQCGKSEVLLNVIGHYIDLDPSPMLMVRPSIDDARDFSEDRIKTMIDLSPSLRRCVRSPTGRREAGNKMLRKVFPGGHLTLVGANSPTGLANRPIRVLLCDEIDKYPASAGDKGDPITLAKNRTRTFQTNWKCLYVTTPGVKGASRSEPLWARSDQRRYFVPCPHCAHFQHLRRKQLIHDVAAYACESCAAVIEEQDKSAMLTAGRWIATNPNGEFPGFHLNSLYSPWMTWRQFIHKFTVAAQSPETLKVFVNEDLAEWWDPQDGEAVNTTALASRRETYFAEVPLGVAVLTAGVDVQHDRLEIAVKGWGVGQESWLILHARIMGHVEFDDVWDRLDAIRRRSFKHESGMPMTIRCTSIDSGDGQTVQSVYAYVKKHARENVYATKGMSVRKRPILNRSGKPNRYGVRVVPVGTDTAKDLIFPRLRLTIPESGIPPRGYMHFPLQQPDGADDEYLEQFGRERAFTFYDHGVPAREYRVVPAGARNEAIDLEVENLVSLHLQGAAVYDRLGDVHAALLAEAAARYGYVASAPRPIVSAAHTPVSGAEAAAIGVTRADETPQGPKIADEPLASPQGVVAPIWPPPGVRRPRGPRGGGYIGGWR